MYSSILFLTLTLLTIASAMIVITSSNVVLSAIALVSVFLFSAVLTMMVGLNFLAITLVLVYVGAVAIFFLFAIMMLDIKIKPTNIGGEIIFFGFGILCVLLLTPNFITEFLFDMDSIFQDLINYHKTPWLQLSVSLENIQAIGQVIYTDLFVHFLIAGYILFVTMMGALMLTLKTNNNATKRQSISDQIERSNMTTVKKFTC